MGNLHVPDHLRQWSTQKVWPNNLQESAKLLDVSKIRYLLILLIVFLTLEPWRAAVASA